MAKETVYFDLETAGLADNAACIQLAAIAVDAQWKELGTYEAKIQFDESLADRGALDLNHYRSEDWKDAKPLSEVTQDFARFLMPFCAIRMTSKAGRPYRVARLAGHNAALFDGPRLQAMFKQTGQFLPASWHVRCTMQRALWWFDEHGINVADFKLATLCAHFGIPIENAHEALADVRATIQLARALSVGSAEVAGAA